MKEILQSLRSFRMTWNGMTIGYFLIFLSHVLTGCGSSKSGESDLNGIKNLNANVWINLMPGSRSAFYVSGSAELNQSASTDSIKLLNCEVLQDGKNIYELYPDSKNPSGFLTDPEQSAGKKISFSFAGVDIKKELNHDKTESLIFHIKISNMIKTFKIQSIEITQAY